MLRRAPITLLCIVLATIISTATASTASNSDTDEPRHLFLKTNGVAWAMGITNIAAEVEVGKHFSFALPMYWSSWDYPKHTTKYRTLAYQPELRYWLQRKGGLFAGAHFGVAWWNIATGGIYRRQDHNGHYPAYGGGISLGWRSMPKKSRFSFEGSMGVGYYHTYYDKFLNTSNGELQYTRTRNLFIIDNLSLSVAYSFNMPRLNK